MSATRPRLQARSRWSSAVKCPRQAAYGLLGVPAEDERLRGDVRALMGLDLDGLRRRGKHLGAVRAEQYAARYGEQNVVLEKEVPWSSGILHEDIFVIPESLVVEVKSVMPKSIDTILDAALLQCAGAVYFDEDAERGLVEFVSPVDETVYEAIPVTLNDDLRERVEEVANAVASAGLTQGKDLPERVCQRPGDSASHMCPFARHCFSSWAEDHPAVEVTDPETVALVQSLYELKRDYKQFNAEAEERKQGYALVQARLVEIGLEPGRDYLVNGFKVRRVVTAGSESFSLSKAIKSGNFTGADYERFSFAISPRAGSERWTVDRVADGAPTDFGSEAPF